MSKIPVLIDVEEIQNALAKHDGGEPERPDSTLSRFTYEIPEIKYVDVELETHGAYKTQSGKARGLVVHYTAGSGKKPINTLRYLASKGLGSMVMGKDGVIWIAKNQGMSKVAWHAGKSAWKSAGGISQYCYGMEIECAGLLDVKNGKFMTWFEEEVPEKEVRFVPQNRHNMRKGYYQAFTRKQEEALLNFCLWQLDTNIEFRIDWIVGHDECAIPSGRKQDPGGALSTSMTEFRAKLMDLAQ